MIKFLFLPFLLMASSPFETKVSTTYNLDMFNTKLTKINKEAMANKKIKCRIVCDKKIYKEQKMAEAISFYKKNN
jgi:hypothetical protein